MRRAHRVDKSQAPIVRDLRGVPGVTVAVTSMVGHGFPDIVVGYRGRTYLFELKSSESDSLTEDEADFFAVWSGHVEKVWTSEEIFDTLGIDY